MDKMRWEKQEENVGDDNIKDYHPRINVCGHCGYNV